MPQKSTRSPGAITSGTVLPAAASTSVRVGRGGVRSSAPGRNREMAILDRSMIALQHDRPRRPFLTIERAARRPRNLLLAQDRLAVEHYRHPPADERDVDRLPLARALRGVLIRDQESVDRSEAARGFGAAHDGVLDLHLVTPAEIDAAVASRRI